jgi:hypothetical protein
MGELGAQSAGKSNTVLMSQARHSLAQALFSEDFITISILTAYAAVLEKISTRTTIARVLWRRPSRLLATFAAYA